MDHPPEASSNPSKPETTDDLPVSPLMAFLSIATFVVVFGIILAALMLIPSR